MHCHGSSTLRRAWRIRLAVLTCVSVLTGMFATPSTASASGIAPATATGSAPRQGDGYRVGHGDFVGYYLVGHTKIYCLSPRAGLPDQVTLRPRARYRGVSRVVSHELAYALARWGNARSAYQAAVESQLLNLLVGNRRDVHRRARHIPHSIAAVVRRRLPVVRRLHGPYRVAVTAGRAVLPGQSGTGSVSVLAASGAAVPYARITLRSSANATVIPMVRTGRSGVGTFSYRATDVGEIRVSAYAGGLAPTWIETNRPARGKQHMVARVPRVHAVGAVSFGRRPTGFTNRYSCSTSCDGRPRTVLRACAPASHRASRLTFHLGERVLALRFAARHRRACRSVTVTANDGERVWASWQWRTGHGWTRAVAAGGTFVVDCPAVPSVAVSMSYDCVHARVRIALGATGADGRWVPLINPTRHRMVLLIGGALQRTLVADPGHGAAFVTSARCGSPRTYTARPGVQRSSGAYNWGAQVSVTTPGVPSAP